MDLVEGILRTLTSQTSYRDLEVVFIDNSRGAHPDGIRRLTESGATVVERHEPFNWSRLNNAGAEIASGDLLHFLNDDMEAIDSDWMDDLVRHVQRPEVGVVGSMLLYPDGMIQHAGVFLVGHGGGAAHFLQGLDPDDDLYLDLQHVTREVSAVTGACLMVARATFEEVGGFDEGLEVSGNDVDFCIRVAATGRRVLWTPRSRLIHHESRSRGSVPYLPDQTRLWDRWEPLLRAGDPYFNPNLDQDRVDCDLDWGRLES
jgi:GT2 family glycosyltransferase